MRGRLRLTVRLRLTLLYGGLFLAAGAALLTINYTLLRANLPDRQVQAKTGQDVIDSARKALTGPSLPAADRVLADKIVHGSPADAAAIAAHPEKVPGGKARLSSFLAALPRTVHAVRNQALDQLLHQSEVALGLMALVSVGLGWLVAGRALRPLAGITAAARRLSAEQLDQRIGMRGPADELKEPADTFDSMLDRLEAAFASQRRFVANAPHELRTPLTIMRTELDMTLRRPEATPEQLRREFPPLSRRLLNLVHWDQRRKLRWWHHASTRWSCRSERCGCGAPSSPAGRSRTWPGRVAPLPLEGDQPVACPPAEPVVTAVALSLEQRT
jgi:HAMP domain-containing protein